MLGLYFLMFVAMSVISILGILLLFLLKSEQGKKAVFYFLVFWGMAIAVLGATSLPSNYIAEQLISWAFGLLSKAALLIRLRAKEKSLILTAHILVSICVAAGMLKLFLF